MTADLINKNIDLLNNENIEYSIKIDNEEYSNKKNNKEKIINVVYEGEHAIDVVFYDEIDPLYLLSLDKLFKELCQIKKPDEDILFNILSKLQPTIDLKDTIINIENIFKDKFDVDKSDFYINKDIKLIDNNFFKADKFQNKEKIICDNDKVQIPVYVENDYLGSFHLYKNKGFDLYEYSLIFRLKEHIKKNIENSFLENKFNIILDKSLNVLTKILEVRIPGAEKHCENVYNYSVEIAKKINLTKKEIEDIKYGSMIFDIGKIGIPEKILSKKEELSKEEKEQIRKHVNNGYELLSKIPTIPEEVKKIVLYHHEKWNGEGYPEALKGNEIPISAQIIGMMDKYFDLMEDKPYRKGMSKSKAIELMKEYKGTRFNPKLVEALKEAINDG